MKQISVKEAIEKLLAGKDVKILIPGAVAEDWADYSPAFLSEYLDGVIFFGDDTDPEEKKAAKKKPAEKKTPAKRKPVDKGKILALHKAGWPVAKIADEMGCVYQTVYKVISDATKNTNNTNEEESKE